MQPCPQIAHLFYQNKIQKHPDFRNTNRSFRPILTHFLIDLEEDTPINGTDPMPKQLQMPPFFVIFFTVAIDILTSQIAHKNKTLS